nr:head maturation protease, ClpP-related [uncultured Oscillibacter sp.]
MRISLNGIVAADDDQPIYDCFGIGAFSPRTVRQALADNPEGEELVLEINSPGGSVFAGGEIYSVLRGAGNVRTRAEIQSLAASAASYLCLGCGEVAISPVALMMLHLPATSTQGDRVEHLRSVGLLDGTREAILNAYELRSGGRADRAALRRMMSAETWLTAQEAVELGLADSVLYQEEAVPQNVMNAAGAGLRALGGGGVPDIALLRAEYRKAKAAGRPEPPELAAPTWQAKARLDLEKIRF